MQILKKMRKQVAVYWAPSGVTGDDGQFLFEAPIELLVYWKDCNEAFVDIRSNSVTSRAKVYVGQNVKLLGFLWLSSKTKGYTAGEALAELADQDVPTLNPGAYEIRKVDKIPTFRIGEFARIVFL